MYNSYNYLFIILINYLLLRVFCFKACRSLIKVTVGSENEKYIYRTLSYIKLKSKSFQCMLIYKQFCFCRSANNQLHTHPKRVKNHGENESLHSQDSGDRKQTAL